MIGRVARLTVAAVALAFAIAVGIAGELHVLQVVLTLVCLAVCGAGEVAAGRARERSGGQ